jgi:hypothetical protein
LGHPTFFPITSCRRWPCVASEEFLIHKFFDIRLLILFCFLLRFESKIIGFWVFFLEVDNPVLICS